MNVMIYLYFTILSVFMQFCIMDLLERNKMAEVNLTSHNNNYLKGALNNTHALYYKIDYSSLIQNVENTTPKYNNLSLSGDNFFDKYYSSSPTLYDLLLEENSTRPDAIESTEIYTTTEYANTTEFEIVPKITTTPKPKTKLKTKELKDCFCDLKVNKKLPIELSNNHYPLFIYIRN